MASEAVANKSFKKAYNGKRIFLVRMLRWGSEENHSYVIGAWSEYKDALEEAEQHIMARGNKYDAEILEIIYDSYHCERYRYVAAGDVDFSKYEEDIPIEQDNTEKS